MTPARTDDRRRRREILRAVYEDNLRVPEPGQGVRRRAASAPRRARRPLALLAAACVLGAGLAALGLGADRGTGAPAEAGLALADEAPGPLLEPAPRASLENPALLPIAELLNLRVKTIVIDPGHGGRDPGALGSAGTREKDLTLDLAQRLRARLLRHPGHRILLTREGDTSVSLRDRVTFANEQGADLFVSIHMNSIPDASVAPVETYYFGLRADDATLRLAHGENAAASYSVAEFNEMLARAGTTIKLQESRVLADSIQASLLRRVRAEGRAVSDWGTKAGPFVVLLGAEAPAVLVEVAAISNPEEEARLGEADYREALAEAIERGLLAYLRQRSPSPDLIATAP